MTCRRCLWGLFGISVLAALAFLLPSSPFYWPDLYNGETRQDGRTARSWGKDLHDSDPQVRVKAIRAIGAIGPEGASELPRLGELMCGEEDRACRIEASLAISKMLPASKVVVEPLGQAIMDPDPWVRMNAVRTLFMLKHESFPALASLIKSLEREDNDTNLDAYTYTIYELTILAVGRASAGKEDGVAVLVELLKNVKSNRLREFIVRSLGEIGPSAKSALSTVRESQQKFSQEQGLQASMRNQLQSSHEDTIRKIENPS
jgi:HEAT repeat protein